MMVCSYDKAMHDASLLLVDDEKPLLALLRKYLERAGYSVEICETGKDAISLCAAQPSRFDVVVLDLKLPDMPGEQVLPQLLAVSPTVRVLISSGTPFSTDSVAPALRPRVASLLKPYLPKMLDEALAKLAAR